MIMNIHDKKYQAHIRKMCRFIHKTRHMKDPDEIIRLAIAQGVINEQEGCRYLGNTAHSKKAS